MSKEWQTPLHDLWNFLLYPGIFLALLVGSTIVHEIGHALAALINGVKPDELIIRWYGVGPGVTVPNSFPTENLPFFRYAGGITAGLVIFLLYVLFWVRPLHTRMAQVQWNGLKWWIGEFLLFWAIFQLFNGYIEGARFEQYVTDSTALHPAFIIAIPTSLLLHTGVTFIRRKIQRRVK
ncbi:hypothetical protein ACFLU1_02885 [Chloroflexota bacterium]